MEVNVCLNKSLRFSRCFFHEIELFADLQKVFPCGVLSRQTGEFNFNKSASFDELEKIGPLAHISAVAKPSLNRPP